MSNIGMDCCEKLWNLHIARFLKSRLDKKNARNKLSITATVFQPRNGLHNLLRPYNSITLKKPLILISWFSDSIESLAVLLSDV